MSKSSIHNTLSEPLSTEVLSRLTLYLDPHLDQDLIEAGIVRTLAVEQQTLTLGLVFNYPCKSRYQEIVMALTQLLSDIDGIVEVTCEIGLDIPKVYEGAIDTIPGVSNVIAVASAKGGVGKSTTAVNLALALAAEGARVGLLDADIYGPSIPIMLGITDFKPVSQDGKTMEPAIAHGIAAMSIGFLVNDDTAAAWRGPMAANALLQLLNETHWPDLDYLVIDLPPGTGDIQLSLSQRVPVSGAVVVTTPQEIATADARKGIVLFNRVHVPILGIVENMSYHLCSNCGSKEHPFGMDGGRQTAEKYDVPFLGDLPLNISIRQHLDEGTPTVVAEPEGELTAAYLDIARQTAAQLTSRSGATELSIEITDE